MVRVRSAAFWLKFGKLKSLAIFYGVSATETVEGPELGEKLNLASLTVEGPELREAVGGGAGREAAAPAGEAPLEGLVGELLEIAHGRPGVGVSLSPRGGACSAPACASFFQQNSAVLYFRIWCEKWI